MIADACVRVVAFLRRDAYAPPRSSRRRRVVDGRTRQNDGTPFRVARASTRARTSCGLGEARHSRGRLEHRVTSIRRALSTGARVAANRDVPCALATLGTVNASAPRAADPTAVSSNLRSGDSLRGCRRRRRRASTRKILAFVSPQSVAALTGSAPRTSTPCCRLPRTRIQRSSFTNWRGLATSVRPLHESRCSRLGTLEGHATHVKSSPFDEARLGAREYERTCAASADADDDVGARR
jgi:hypothetical protein